MNRLSKEDLAQMSGDYFQFLDKQKLLEVAGNLHALANAAFLAASDPKNIEEGLTKN